MEKTTEFMYAIYEGNNIVAIYPDHGQAEAFVEFHQTVERIRVEITRITGRS
jgi:hypothetical protein